MDAIEIVMDVEETFEISVPDEALERFRTVADLSMYIAERLHAGQEGSKWTADEIDCRLFKIVSKNLGVPLDSVRPSARFVEDLRMD